MIAKANNTETRIEFRHVNGSSRWSEISNPGFLPEYEYRIVGETFYKIGQRFEVGDTSERSTYILAVTGPGKVGLVNLQSGILWSGSTSVGNTQVITEKEMKETAYYNPFQLVPKE